MMREEIVYSKELAIINEELINTITQNDNVYREIHSFINGTSKRIRSILGILYLKSSEKFLSDEVVQILTAGEIIHNASLLHDDVIDNAVLRRNQETIAHKFNSHISILTGDYLISLAVERLLNLSNDKILKLFLDCTKKMSEAEILQYNLRNKDTTLEKYLTICEGKTSSLFIAILESVALVSGLDIQPANILGKYFGLIFQIRNDCEKTSAKSDKANGIKTAKDIIGIEKTQTLIDNYKEKILDTINNFPQNKYKQALGELIKNL